MDPVASYEPDVDGRERLKSGGSFKGTLGPGELHSRGLTPLRSLSGVTPHCAVVLGQQPWAASRSRVSRYDA